MKIIIYLASHDPSARNNFMRLREARTAFTVENVFCGYLHVVNEKLVPADGKDLFKDIPISERNNVTVEFVCHGSPVTDNEILSIQRGAYKPNDSNTFSPITPDILAKFFQTYASNNNQYKFSKLTLFCCSSEVFGERLSENLRGIQVECFSEDIFINLEGNPFNGHNQTKPASPRVFYKDNPSIAPQDAQKESRKETRAHFQRNRSNSLDSYFAKTNPNLTLEQHYRRNSDNNPKPPKNPEPKSTFSPTKK